MSEDPTPGTSRTGKGKEGPEPRVFYSKTSAEDFINHFSEMLDKRDDDVKSAIQTLSDNIAALTAAILGRDASPMPPVPPHTSVSPTPPAIPRILLSSSPATSHTANVDVT